MLDKRSERKNNFSDKYMMKDKEIHQTTQLFQSAVIFHSMDLQSMTES